MGLSDYVSGERKKIGGFRRAGLALLLGTFLFSFGCSAAQNRAVGNYLVGTTIDETVRGKVRNYNDRPQRENNDFANNWNGKFYLELREWRDSNGDGKISGDELSRIKGSSVDLRNCELVANIYPNSAADVKYTTISPDGKILGETYIDGQRVIRTFDKVYSGDAMDNLNGESMKNPGKYTIMAVPFTGQVLSREITITGNN